jgi:hypothetical protein
MARDRANIATNIWTDQDWRNLPTAQQHLYLLLTSHPTLSYSGVADWREARLAAMTADATPESVRAAAEGLQAERFVFIDDETEEILIRSFLRHDGLLKQPKLSISMVNAYGAIASARVREVVTFELQKLYREFPEWAAFGQEKVQALLRGKGTDMAEFTHGLTPSFTPAFTLNVARPDPLPTATATTTATEDKSSTPPTPDGAAEFDEWYAVYPRKTDKGHARTAFKTARKKTTQDVLMASVRRFAHESKGVEQKFLAYPATWLNGERWEDETPQQTVIAGPWSKDFHKNGTQA